MVLWQRGQDQPPAASLSVAVHHGVVHRTEELLKVAVAGGLLDVSTVPSRVAGGAVRAVRAFAAVSVLVEHGIGRLRGFAPGGDLLQAVAVAFIQGEAVAVQAQNLVAVSRLCDAHQRLGVKAVSHHHKLNYWALQAVGAKHAGRAQHRQAIGRVIPESFVVGQCLERLKQWRDFALGVFQTQRRFHFFHQIAKADRVLHVVRVLAVGGLIQREAGRLLIAQENGWVIKSQRIHGEAFRNNI